MCFVKIILAISGTGTKVVTHKQKTHSFICLRHQIVFIVAGNHIASQPYDAKTELDGRVDLIRRNVKNLLKIAKRDSWVCDNKFFIVQTKKEKFVLSLYKTVNRRQCRIYNYFFFMEPSPRYVIDSHIYMVNNLSLHLFLFI